MSPWTSIWSNRLRLVMSQHVFCKCCQGEVIIRSVGGAQKLTLLIEIQAVKSFSFGLVAISLI